MHLQGAVSQTFSIASNVLGTLVSAAPQNRVVYTIVHTFNGTYADVAVNPNGQIALIDSRPPAVLRRRAGRCDQSRIGEYDELVGQRWLRLRGAWMV